MVRLPAGDTEGEATHRAHCDLARFLADDGGTAGKAWAVHHIWGEKKIRIGTKESMKRNLLPFSSQF